MSEAPTPDATEPDPATPPPRILVVDNTAAITEMVSSRSPHELGAVATCLESPAEVPDAVSAETFVAAIIDMQYPEGSGNGLDVLMAVYQAQPTCRLVVYTDGDPPVADMLRDAWHAFELAGMVSKSSRSTALFDAMRTVLAGGSAPLDPVIAPRIPTARSTQRDLASYGRLVQHAGWAKLWRALIDLPDGVAYDAVADYTGLTLASVSNYRAGLRDELRIHEVDNPTMPNMQQFGKRCHALLRPHIERRLDADWLPYTPATRGRVRSTEAGVDRRR